MPPGFARQQRLKTVTGLSPTGGINSVAALSSMQPDEVVQMTNMWPGAGGAKSRLGSAVHTQNLGHAQSIFTPPTSATATCVINGVSFTATFNTDADTTINDLIALIEASAPTIALVTPVLYNHTMVLIAVAAGAGGDGITTTSNNANGASFDRAATSNGGSYGLTVIPFHGEDGAQDRLFVANSIGIWDCSVPGNPPVLSIAFASSANHAGIGSTTNFSSVGDHFGIYCDEENGYYLYTESAGTWQRVGSGAASTSVYTPLTTGSGTVVINGVTFDVTFVNNASETITTLMASIRANAAVSALVSVDSNGTTMTVTAVTPGTAGNGITTTATGTGASFSNASTTGGVDGVYGVDPHDFVFPCNFQRRLWFCEKGSSTGWFLPFDSVFGEAQPFNFGASQPAGGALKCMANWTVDSGNGVGNNLAVISEAGNVSVYSGTDPEVGPFQLVGVWFVGGFPVGRNITTGDGGDVLIATNLGVVSLAKYLQGLSLADRSLYATKNIQNLIAAEVQANATLYGWQMIVTPDEQAIILLVPQQDSPSVSYGAPYATRNWCYLTGRPATSYGVYLEKLYFTDQLGNLMKVDGSLDYVDLNNQNGQPIPWGIFGSFQGYGTPAVRKRAQMLRPYFTTTGNPPSYTIVSRYDYDLTAAPNATTPIPVTGTSVWDAGLWDVAVWGGGGLVLYPFQQLIGAAGEGHTVAIALNGYAIEPTTLVQVDVLYEEGNYW